MKELNFNNNFISIIHNSGEKEIAVGFHDLLQPFFRGHLSIKLIDSSVLRENQIIPEQVEGTLYRSKLISLVVSDDTSQNYFMNFIAGIAWTKEIPMVTLCPPSISHTDLGFPLELLPSIETSNRDSIMATVAPIVTTFTGQAKPHINLESFMQRVNSYERHYDFSEKCRRILTKIMHISPEVLPQLAKGKTLDIVAKEWQIDEVMEWAEFLLQYHILDCQKTGYISLSENGVYVSVRLIPLMSLNHIIRQCNLAVMQTA